MKWLLFIFGWLPFFFLYSLQFTFCLQLFLSSFSSSSSCIYCLRGLTVFLVVPDMQEKKTGGRQCLCSERESGNEIPLQKFFFFCSPVHAYFLTLFYFIIISLFLFSLSLSLSCLLFVCLFVCLWVYFFFFFISFGKSFQSPYIYTLLRIYTVYYIILYWGVIILHFVYLKGYSATLFDCLDWRY